MVILVNCHSENGSLQDVENAIATVVEISDRSSRAGQGPQIPLAKCVVG